MYWREKKWFAQYYALGLSNSMIAESLKKKRAA